MYDASLNRTLDAVNIIPFQSDEAFGSVSDPYVITSNNDPTNFSLTSTSIVEAEGKNSTVGMFSTVDPDTASVFTYRFIDSLPNDNSSFLIVGNELKTNAVFDYNVKSSYIIYVLVEDGKGGTLMKRIEIMVTPSEDKFVADNYLSPNGDGINDLWEINNYQLYKKLSGIYFQRSRSYSFSQKPYDNKWAGNKWESNFTSRCLFLFGKKYGRQSKIYRYHITSKIIYRLLFLYEKYIQGNRIYFLYFFSKHLFSQGIANYNLYMQNTLAINPAYAGSHDGFFNLLHFRNQMTTVADHPRSFSYYAHSPIGINTGLGGNITVRKGGVFQTTSANLATSYKVLFAKNHKITFGLSGGVVKRSLDYVLLQNADLSDPTLQTGSFDKLNYKFGFWSTLQLEKF